jgi:hypothetical protein
VQYTFSFFIIREFVKNNLPMLIGRCPILNDDALLGLSFCNKFKKDFDYLIISKNPERVIAFRIG